MGNPTADIPPEADHGNDVSMFVTTGPAAGFARKGKAPLQGLIRT